MDIERSLYFSAVKGTVHCFKMDNGHAYYELDLTSQNNGGKWFISKIVEIWNASFFQSFISNVSNMTIVFPTNFISVLIIWIHIYDIYRIKVATMNLILEGCHYIYFILIFIFLIYYLSYIQKKNLLKDFWKICKILQTLELLT